MEEVPEVTFARWAKMEQMIKNCIVMLFTTYFSEEAERKLSNLGKLKAELLNSGCSWLTLTMTRGSVSRFGWCVTDVELRNFWDLYT